MHDVPQLPRSRFPWRRFAAGAALGTAVALGAVAVVLLYRMRGTTPRLTPEAFAAARENWRPRGPRDYELTIVQTGARTGTIEVVVRDGEVTRMTIDGLAPTQKRTWYYWSVPGMFDVVERDLDSAPTEQLVLRAEFDPQFGYPRKYERVALRTRQQSGWEVVRFEPGDGGSAAEDGRSRYEPNTMSP